MVQKIISTAEIKEEELIEEGIDLSFPQQIKSRHFQMSM